MNLYFEDKLIDQKGFEFNVHEYGGLIYTDLKEFVEFKTFKINNYGQSIPVRYYKPSCEIEIYKKHTLRKKQSVFCFKLQLYNQSKFN